MKLTYKNETPLFIILLLISSLVWLGLLVVTKGLVLLYFIAFILFYIIAQSGFISYLKGTGVEITAEQFPDLHDKIVAACDKLNIDKIPHFYLLHMGGVFNALATRFLGRNYVVLFSDIVDALDEKPDALNFYIGHELGHIKQKHLTWTAILAPAIWLPIIGTAYSRAKEYTCDRYGFSVCAEPASAMAGIAVLAAGGKRWRTINTTSYSAQVQHSSGFWMSLYELISDYPWLTKRQNALNALSNNDETQQPRRHLLAWIIALFIPRFGLGGSLSGLMVVVAIIGILAAVAIPAYQDYINKAKIISAFSVGKNATVAVGNYISQYQTLPANLQQTSFAMPPKAEIESIAVSPDNAVITLRLSLPSQQGNTIEFIPSMGEDKVIHWKCRSPDLKANLLPADCR